MFKHKKASLQRDEITCFRRSTSRVQNLSLSEASHKDKAITEQKYTRWWFGVKTHMNQEVAS